MRPFDRIVTASEDGARSCNASRWNCVLFSRWMRGVSVSTVVRGISEGGACDDNSNEYVRRRPPPELPPVGEEKGTRLLRLREHAQENGDGDRGLFHSDGQHGVSAVEQQQLRLLVSELLVAHVVLLLPSRLTWKWRGQVDLPRPSQNATLTWVVTEPLNPAAVTDQVKLVAVVVAAGRCRVHRLVVARLLRSLQPPHPRSEGRLQGEQTAATHVLWRQREPAREQMVVQRNCVGRLHQRGLRIGEEGSDGATGSHTAANGIGRQFRMVTGGATVSS